VAVRIELAECINCGLCRRVCPTETIRYFTTHHRTHVVESAGCIDCDLCIKVCPENCIVHDAGYTHAPLELAAAKERARGWARSRNELNRQLRARAVGAIAAVHARPRAVETA
jgi:formate hydrogenlyase subunit 6/NADH:ubiquinone oxidoreductase subunit I